MLNLIKNKPFQQWKQTDNLHQKIFFKRNQHSLPLANTQNQEILREDYTGEQFFFHFVLHEIFQLILDRFLTLIPNLKSVFIYML